MSSRRLRGLVVLSCCLLFAVIPHALAQNENETVGFQSTHAFESGHFGEDIDVLNGGLHLTIPLGPRYQVNDRLGYQLLLSYNSKVWEYSDYVKGDSQSVRPYNAGPSGLGFTLNLGRLIQDRHNRVCTGGGNCYMTTYKWVMPDGSQHDVWFKEGGPVDTPTDFPLRTKDTSYVIVNPPGEACLENEDANCFTVMTPDGLTYMMGRYVPYLANIYNTHRADNLSFGGWYVTRIEDRSIRDGVTGYRHWVRIEYDTRLGFDHVIKKITDSHKREIVFENCKFGSSGVCDESASSADVISAIQGSPTVYNRHAIATRRIKVPRFWGQEQVPSTEAEKAASKAEYVFTYAYRQIRGAHFGSPDCSSTVTWNCNILYGPLLQLERLDYPAYENRATGGTDVYSLFFGYDGPEDPPVNRGELTCRTMPIRQAEVAGNATCLGLEGSHAVFKYDYTYYPYAALFFTAVKLRSGRTGKNSGGLFASPGISSATRHVVTKKLNIPGEGTKIWSYRRESSAGFTNPTAVTITDAFQNDTVYYYRATYPPAAANPHVGDSPDDGIAPDWDDGLNYRIEYYRSTGAARQLLRSENLEYDSDVELDPVILVYSPGKRNIRMKRKQTIFHDDGGSETVVAHSDWDNFGNWRTVAETGFGVPVPRVTYTRYLDLSGSTTYVSGLYDYREVHDGQRVLERHDNEYKPDGRLLRNISRRTLPVSIGRSKDSTSVGPGDVKTAYTYDPQDGSVVSGKTLSRGRLDGTGEVSDYCIEYVWHLSAYLKKKRFVDCSTGQPLGWWAIDRKRDGNTGAIFSVKDTSGLETTYAYDAVGRLTGIVPPGGDFPSRIDYVSLRETTLSRGDQNNFEFSRYSYDRLGRVIREERRPADPSAGNPYRHTCYDAANRVTFQSEWLSSVPSGGPGPCDRSVFAGTTFDFGTPPDPFGRVQQVTTADNRTTTTSYQGLDTTVTVNDVKGVGPAGGFGSVTTRYFRDGLGRLIMVDGPSERRCNNWGAVCTSDAQCPTGQTCRATDGADAIYAYDLRDNLVQVELIEQGTARKQARYFEYDGLNRLHSSHDPEKGSVVVGEYDAVGNVLSMRDAAGVVLKYDYDPAGRLETVLREGVAAPLLANQYDSGAFAGTYALGKLTGVAAYEDDGSLVTHKFLTYSEPAGRISRVINRFAEWPSSTDQSASYTYNPFGGVSTISYPTGGSGSVAGLTVAYDYMNGIPVAARDGSGAVLARLTYNAAGGIKSLTTMGGARTEIEPDSRHRPSRLRIGKWGTDDFVQPLYFAAKNYAYDGAGNIYQISHENGSVKSRYLYDTVNRLVEAHEVEVGVNYLQCFTYDAFGNLIGKQDRSGVSATQTCQGLAASPWDQILMLTAPNGTNTNRILSQQIASGGVASFLYDARGNLTKDWERRYTYDSRNRMTAVHRLSNFEQSASQALELARYEYEADGGRVLKRDLVRDLDTYYFRGPDGGVLTEYRRTALGSYTPEWVKHHVYLGGRAVASRDNRVPSPPGRLTATTQRQGNSSTVKLQWKKNPSEDNVTNYVVFRSIWGGPLVHLETTPGNCTASDPSLLCYQNGVSSDTYVEYQVAASSAGLVSYGSDIVGFMSGDNSAPAPPTCLRLTAGDQQVTASWTASPSGDVVGYNIYRSTSPTGGQARINGAPVAQTRYVDGGLTNDGPTYYYAVKAVDTVGLESAYIVNTGCSPAAVTSARPRDLAAPGPPRNLVVTGDCQARGTASLGWEANADTDAVTIYLVFRKAQGGSVEGPWATGTDPLTGKPATFFNDSGLAPGAVYAYWIVAQDANLNRSPASQTAGVAQRSTSVPVPPGKLMLAAGDGQVRVRFKRPDDSSRIRSFVIYRKLNADPSCASLLEVGALHPSSTRCSFNNQTPCTTDADCPGGTCQNNWGPAETPFLNFTDGTVGNNLAWDYAVASRDGNQNESGISEIALAIPTAPPRDFRECVEIVPSTTAEECTCALQGSCRNHVVSWTLSSAKPYHPLTASNADGTLSYMLGSHVRRYRPSGPGVSGCGLCIQDQSTITELNLNNLVGASTRLFCSENGSICSGTEIDRCGGNSAQSCVRTGTCEMQSPVSCATQPCANGTTCAKRCTGTTTICTKIQDCPQGTCDSVCVIQNPIACLQKTDCPGTAVCSRDTLTRVDDYLLQVHGPRMVYPLRIVEGSNCLTVSNVYKVFANGNWVTVTSQPSSNYDPTKTSADSSSIIARCLSSARDVCNTDPPPSGFPECSTLNAPPPVTVAPTATVPQDGQGSLIPGRLTVTWTPPADLTSVAGYYLYIKEMDDLSLVVHQYSAMRPTPFVTLPRDQNTYELSTLPRSGRGVDRRSSPSTYEFRVATFDIQGRVSNISPKSNPASVYEAAETPYPPRGLKTVIWTVNDSSGDGSSIGGPVSFKNPRSYDGIKLQWKAGSWTGLRGFRVYRSDMADGQYCAILKQGASNPPNTVICPDSNAYSESLTRAVAEGGNNRFFWDRNVEPGRIYYYKVISIGDSGSASNATGFSEKVAGMALERPAQPLSPPRHFKAWAPRVPPRPDVYLRWCPNPTEEGATGYKVYRSRVKGGPYALIAVLTNPANKAHDCLLGSRRCMISCATPPCTNPPALDPATCSLGVGGTCKLVDDLPIQPNYQITAADQANHVYYYVVTAVRGTEESPYSVENAAWPNYECTTDCNPPTYMPRFDHDHVGDIGCDDEVTRLEADEDFQKLTSREPSLSSDLGGDESGEPLAGGLTMAPYRVVGVRRPSGGGGGGGAPPAASGRWLFYHTDHLGSPRVITDDLGNIVSTHHYMPFGDEKPLGARLTSNNRKFTGHERDIESASRDNPDGLDYMMARYYGSGLGRFMSPDPLAGDRRFPQSLNRYSYVMNNPLNATDPTGMKLEYNDHCALMRDMGGCTVWPEGMGPNAPKPKTPDPEGGDEKAGSHFLTGATDTDDWIDKLPPEEREKEIQKLRDKLNDPNTSPREKSQIKRRLRELERRPGKKGQHDSDKDHNKRTAEAAGPSTAQITTGVVLVIGGAIYIISTGGAGGVLGGGAVVGAGVILITGPSPQAEAPTPSGPPI